MVKPLEILDKMLDLEARDYAYNDRAVAGGLSRYAETWRRQARQAFGESAEAWVSAVGRHLDMYSSLAPDDRREAVVALRALLHGGPEAFGADAGGVPAAPEALSEGDTPRTVEAPQTMGAPQTEVVTAEAAVEAEPETTPANTVAEQAHRPAEPEAPPAPEPQSTPRSQPGRGLDASIQVLPGVGEKRAGRLDQVGVRTVRDFIYHFPRRYEDYSQLMTISRLEYGERVSVLVTVWEAGARRTHKGGHLFSAIVGDNTGTIEVTWFGPRHLEDRIRSGMQLLLSGKVGQHLGRLTMNSPEFEIVGRTEVMNARIQPIYPLTEGLTQRWMRTAMRRALNSWANRIPDPLPQSLREREGLISLTKALWGVHLPDNQEHLAAARRRLAFEETLYLQLGLLRQKLIWKREPGRAIPGDPERLAALKAALPYALTHAQERSLREMLGDMASGDPMNRLLEGDVGSGKTVVAALLMATVADQGLQAAMMAPTEILAEQHAKSLAALFAQFPEPQPKLAMLTGSTQGVEREAVYAGLADGSIQVVVGTHALIQESVAFKDLALVVIDEQHRFGVEQRGLLRGKGYNPHLLVMTATPIPRSLELTLWGHVDVSVLDEMPPGRQPVRTRVLHPRERGRAYTFIQKQVGEGRQAFIIYPLVEASDKIEARSAVEEHERLQQEVFPTMQLGLLHGRMRSEEKEQVMARFGAGELDVLVATSVVEVGIDVPNATVMLIDGADRFGLAQLHQFRGRVGRGEHQSYCLLLAEDPSDQASERLSALESTTDGFELAQKDLEMRGPGEFLGTQQSGFPEVKMATFTDTRLLYAVREIAAALLDDDPDLAQPEHQLLREQVQGFWQDTGDLS